MSTILFLSKPDSEDHGKQTTPNAQDRLKLFVLGSDTIVDLKRSILEKLENEEGTIQMLMNLLDKWHKVHTGVSLFCADVAVLDNHSQNHLN